MEHKNKVQNTVELPTPAYCILTLLISGLLKAVSAAAEVRTSFDINRSICRTGTCALCSENTKH